jgi:hypothetical protein
MNKWTKLGQIYTPASQGRHPKLLTHAANPLPVHIEGDVYRIFYSGRDHRNRSSVGAVDMNIVTREIVKDHYEPFFEHGTASDFYVDGVSIGNCYEADGQRYMLFMGWQTPPDGHWRGDVGRLILHPDLTLTLDSTTPFMSTDDVDQVSLSYPWVEQNEAGDFSMWYGSTLTWNSNNDEMLHVINFASSADGHHWERQGLAIPYALGVAQAFSRPTVVRNSQGLYQMWFSYRSGTGEKYRIGYAFSQDGKKWELALQETGITVSDQGWDAEMIEYPFILDHQGERYMLYNGNGYGKTGFGLAILEHN